MGYDPSSATYRVGDVVIRDEVQLIPGRLMASAGVRLDYDSYRQFDYQPSVRLLYTPDTRQTFWAAASRAVRAANRLDRDLKEYGGSESVLGLPMQLWVYGSKTMRSEVERSVETGYRFQSGQRWSVDASIYWSYYERLRALYGPYVPVLTFTNGSPVLLLAGTACNCGTGRSYGAEIWGTWQVRPGWRLSPSYSYLNERRWLPPHSAWLSYVWDGTPSTFAHQGVLRSQHDLTRQLQLDVTLRPRSGDEQLFHLPATLFVDARLGWRPTRSGELSLTVRNLTGRNVLAGIPELTVAALPLRRTVILQWTQRF